MTAPEYRSGRGSRKNTGIQSRQGQRETASKCGCGIENGRGLLYNKILEARRRGAWNYPCAGFRRGESKDRQRDRRACGWRKKN